MLPENFNRDAFITQLREKHSRILPSDLVFAVEDGWLPMVGDFLQEVEDITEKWGLHGRIIVRQIKEKLGTLRIYVRSKHESDTWPEPAADDFFQFSKRVNQRSLVTCEHCGDGGDLGNFGGYLQTLCPRHASQRRAWIAGGRKGDIFHD